MERRKALVIGINDYKSSPLKCCVNDAKSVVALLEKNEDKSPNFTVKEITEYALEEKLKCEIKELFSGTADVALLYFSGHGSSDEHDSYIVSQDEKLISMDEILKYANNSEVRNKIIILDSCFSGGLGKIGPLNSPATVINDGVTIMTASSENEYSIETGDHGLFTSLLLQALDGYASDIMGNITPAGIYSFIDQALGAWDQRPIFKTNTKSFYFLRQTKPRVEISTLREINNYFPYENFLFKLDPSFEDTNSKKVKHILKEPYADDENVKKFKVLQLYQKVGLVEPVGEDYMYYAAMRSKSCRLTNLGKRYLKLVNEKRI